MMEKLAFLKSVRFWKIAIAFGVQLLVVHGSLSADIANAISGILGASVVINTADRYSK